MADPRNGPLPYHNPTLAPPRNRSFAKKGEPCYLCPFGCMDPKRVDRNGYCRHLIGFVNGETGHKPKLGTTVELREKIDVDNERVGEIICEIKAGDRLVPMIGVCWRVYRKDGRAPVIASSEHKHRVRTEDMPDEPDDEFLDEVDNTTDEESEAFVAARAERDRKIAEREEQKKVKFNAKPVKKPTEPEPALAESK